MAEPCHTCKHYNNGEGDSECLFCDSEFEDRWEENKEDNDMFENDMDYIRKIRKYYNDNIAVIYCLIMADKYLVTDPIEAKKYFEFTSNHLYSSVRGKTIVRLFLDIQEGLKED